MKQLSFGRSNIHNVQCFTCVILVPIYLFVNSYITDTMAGPAVSFEKSIYDFSVDLYENVREGKDENIILSPLSVQIAVGLALMGARGQTAEEMSTGLKLTGLEREGIADGFQKLLEPFQNSSTLKIANKVYAMKNYHIKSDFNEIASKSFHSEAETLDFGENESSANTINGWVEEKTNDLVKNLISPDSLNSDTRMVLVNAIYFKGMWQKPFPKQNTHKAPFYSSETESVDVDTMNVKSFFRYGQFEDLDAKAIELPYEDSDLSMLIILPNTKTGLADLENHLKTVDLAELTQKMYPEEVVVSLPKFKIEFEVSLPDILKKMGMPTMFSDAADFSGLFEEAEPIKVSDVIHKAVIDVNEEGAEAAAATGLMAVNFSAYIGPDVEFKADHQFKFLIKRKNNVIFSGRYKK